jgi:hypothetical protein
MTPPTRATWSRALRRWLKRYVPAELVAAPCALLSGLAVGQLTGSSAAAALAATWGENVGFYGLMIGRELVRRRTLRALPGVVRALALEFGPAEALDSLLLRPAAVYAGLALAPHPALGMLAGKLAADVTFYLPAIACHELQRAWERRGRRALLPAASALVCFCFATAGLA